MAKEELALEFVNKVAELFKEDIASIKADEEPINLPGDAINSMHWVLEEVIKILEMQNSVCRWIMIAKSKSK